MTIKTPPVGWPVQFFPGGTKSNDPWAAVVVQCGDNGRVKLNCSLAGGGELRSSGEFVPHITDPWVSEHQEALRKSRGMVQRGAWDYVPGLVPGTECPAPPEDPQIAEKPEPVVQTPIAKPAAQKLEEPAESPADEREARRMERRQEGIEYAIDLFERGMSPDAVFGRAKTYGFSRIEVEAIAKELKSRQPV